MLDTDNNTFRLLKSVPLPSYTYAPGSNLPHPFRDADGHSHDRKTAVPPPLDATRWADSKPYLLALDLFNWGDYWEAHEEWDRLLKVADPESLEAKFLKGLVKMSAAGMKVREHSIHGVRRHSASAGEIFADVAAESGGEHYCGLEFTSLQFAADRAAQLSYNQEHPVGQPIRAFPFLLRPTPLPLG